MYPFYPLFILIGLALVLGALALEFPYLGVLLAILLSVFGAMYQDPFAGLTYLVVFLVFAPIATSWIEVGLLGGGWILTFLLLPSWSSLAIMPTILAGLHLSRQSAFKFGALSSISIFLLSWSRGIAQAGLMFVPFPSSMYAAKPIPEPWRFPAFVPGADILDATKLGNYYSPLLSTIGDIRLYILIALWCVGAYVIAFLANKWKRSPAYLGVGVVGILPIVIASAVIAQTSPLQLAAALVAGVVVTAAYKYVQPLVSGPGLGIFARFEDLVPSGFPQKYSVLLGSPVCEERNLLVEQFLATKQKTRSFLLTSDIDFGQNAAARFAEKLTVLIANPRATSGQAKNVVAVPTGVQNLTALNIELVKAVKEHAGSGARICVDVLTEVMLTQKLLTTRKWVTDILPRLEGWEFTVLGVFNPSLHSNEDIQGLSDLFRGYVEIYDKDFGGRTRKVITVHKMIDLQYKEAELIVDRELMRQRERKGGLRGRLSR